MSLTQEEIDALPSELTIDFAKPIVIGETSYSSLTFREPSAFHLKEVGKMNDPTEAAITLLGYMAGVLPVFIERLTARQFKRASAFAESFMQDARPTGAAA